MTPLCPIRSPGAPGIGPADTAPHTPRDTLADTLRPSSPGSSWGAPTTPDRASRPHGVRNPLHGHQPRGQPERPKGAEGGSPTGGSAATEGRETVRSAQPTKVPLSLSSLAH